MIDVRELLDEFDIVDMQNLDIDYGISGEKAGLAVALYNKALKKMNEGCFDLARIDLRKSVNLYPNFSDAVILLGICVFAGGDRSEAVGIFNSVKGEHRDRALDYLDRLHEISLRPESASVRNTVRTSRIPDGVYGNENKLDEIMRKPQHVSREYDSSNDDIDADMKVIGNTLAGDDEDDIAMEVVPMVTESEDDDLEMEVLSVENISKDNEVVNEDVIVETNMDYVRKEILGLKTKDADEDVSSETSADVDTNEEVAPYGSIRRANRERFERTEGKTSRPTNVERRQAVSGQGEARATIAEYKRIAEEAEAKSRETSAQAERNISNLQNKVARSYVISIVLGIISFILIIIIIIMGVVISTSSNDSICPDCGSEKICLECQDSNPAPSNSPENPPTSADPNKLKEEAKASYDSAKSLYEQAKYYEAAEILYGIDKNLLDVSTKVDVEKMYSDAVAKFVPTYNTNFNSNAKEGSENWEAMIQYGEPVFKHNPDYNSKGAHLSFLIGKAYDELGRQYKISGDATKAEEYFVKAESYYNNTMTKYPDSPESKNGWASYRLSQMNKLRQ